MKAMYKDGWFPKWIQRTIKEGFWLQGTDPGAKRPRPLHDPKKTNYDRMTERKLRRIST